jgi:hypothetical protein
MRKFDTKDMTILAEHLIGLDRASWWLDWIIYTTADVSDNNQTKAEFKDMYGITPLQAEQLIARFIKYLEWFTK